MKAHDLVTYVGRTKFEGCVLLPVEDGGRDPPPPEVSAMCCAWVYAAVEFYKKHADPGLEVPGDVAILDAAFDMCQYGNLSVDDFDAKARESEALNAATVEHAAAILSAMRALFLSVRSIENQIVTYDNAREIARRLNIPDENVGRDYRIALHKQMEVAMRRFTAATHRACRSCIAHIPDITYQAVEQAAEDVERMLGIQRATDVPDTDQTSSGGGGADADLPERAPATVRATTGDDQQREEAP